MRASATPNFFVVLDLLIQAFHLDNEDPALGGSGPFQHQLSGRRFDIKDETLQRLLRKFAAAVLRSDVLPILGASLIWDPAGARSDDVARCLGYAGSLPSCGDEVEATFAERLSWLAEQYEAGLSKARSQDLGDEVDPAFALMPMMRFGWHHLTFAFAGLLWCGSLQDADLDGQAPHWTWGMETPTSTPMRAACIAAGRTRADVTSELSGADPDRERGWNVKTLDNLWNGGPAHPTFDSLAMVAELLCPNDPAVLPRWRRWYGLRELARQFARHWGWEWLGGCLGTTVVHARTFARDLHESPLTPDERRVVASVGIWAGWRVDLARSCFRVLSHLSDEDVHPTLRLDYRAIAQRDESLRIDDCVAMSGAWSRLPAELQRRGQSADSARSDALHLCWMWQSDLTQFAHLDPLAALFVARESRNWRAAERAARELVKQRPKYAENHFFLVEALAQLDRFDEALAVAGTGRSQFPSDSALVRAEIRTRMLRGEQRRSHVDFETARDMVLALHPSESDWESHLTLADCYLALGAWESARGACKLVVEHRDQCGEAYAIASICCTKLGERQASSKAADHAVRRGEQALLDLLRQRDAAGELGSALVLPVPRWHRMCPPPEFIAPR